MTLKSAFALLALAVALPVLSQQDQKDSGGIKQDAKDAAHATGRAAKKTGRKIKKGTKKVVHKTAEGTRKGAEKLENKTASPTPTPPQM